MALTEQQKQQMKLEAEQRDQDYFGRCFSKDVYEQGKEVTEAVFGDYLKAVDQCPKYELHPIHPSVHGDLEEFLVQVYLRHYKGSVSDRDLYELKVLASNHLYEFFEAAEEQVTGVPSKLGRYYI